MRAVVQRVREARVDVEGQTVSRIGPGLLVLLAVHRGDGPSQVAWMADKLVNLRLFPDDAGKMNRSTREICGEILLVSQFTLYGDCRRGRRPSYVDAAPPELAEALYMQTCQAIAALGVPCQTGVFRAMMDVYLVNNGPVTVIVDTPTNND